MLITTDKQFRRAIGWLTLAFSAAMIVLGETVLALTSPPEPREIKLAWNPPTNAVEFAELRYQVYLGTNSGSYFTNWTVMSTNAVVNITNLVYGTNFIAVAARVNYETNALISEPSNEIQIYRAAPPRLKISFTLLSGTNANGPWTESVAIAEHDAEITPGQKFFAVKMTPTLTP